MVSGGELLNRSESDAGRRAVEEGGGGEAEEEELRFSFTNLTSLQSLMHRKTLEVPSFMLLQMSPLR